MGIAPEGETTATPPESQKPNYRWRFVAAGPDEKGIEQPHRMIFGGTPEQPNIVEVSAYFVKQPNQMQLSQLESPGQITDLHQALHEAHTLVRIMQGLDRTLPPPMNHSIESPQISPAPNSFLS